MAPFLIGLFAAAAVLSYGICWLVRRNAVGRGATVPPRPDRWHRHATPTFGGVAIAVTSLTLSGAVLLSAPSLAVVVAPLAVALAALAMFVAGLADDSLQLTPLAKLVASLVVGAFFVFGLTAPAGLPSWVVVLAIVWFGGIVHALNLLDNMDGLAAGVGLIACLFTAWVFGADLGLSLVALLVAVAGSLAGFFVWNRHPARLFMGDCGSLFIFIGAVLAGTSLVPLMEPAAPLPFEALAVIPPLVVWCATVVVLAAALLGQTPLWPVHDLTTSEAAALRDSGELRRLLDHGADPNARAFVRAGALSDEPLWLTPLEAGVAAQRLEVVTLLLDHGANIDVASHAVLVCLAQRRGDTAVADFLVGRNGGDRSPPRCDDVALPW